jgi:hypothetical protein
LNVALTSVDQQALTEAAAATRRVRHWRRYRAVLLQAGGQPTVQVAQALACTEQSVRVWHRHFRQAGVAAQAKAVHPGAVPRRYGEGS